MLLSASPARLLKQVPTRAMCPGTTTTLQATAPFVGTGLWTIVTGSGGSIANPSDPVSTFTGIPGYYLGSYTLKWTVTSNCTSVWDQVFINFVCSPMPTPANAGPDQLNVSGVTTTLAGNIPEFGTGTWTIVDESGYGIIAEPNNPTSTFTGINFAYYILQWENVDTCGTTFDEVEIDFAEFSCGNTFQDTRDATVYTTVQIGTQCWMKKNLKYAAGTGACGGSPPDCDLYGRLYNYSAASTACPTGWHVPTDAQFCTLAHGLDATVTCSNTGALGTDAGGKMKETGTTYWLTPNTGATNSSGFSGRGAGSSFSNPFERESFWSSTNGSGGKWCWELLYDDAKIYRNVYNTSSYMSVRCLKN